MIDEDEQVVDRQALLDDVAGEVLGAEAPPGPSSEDHAERDRHRDVEQRPARGLAEADRVRPGHRSTRSMASSARTRARWSRPSRRWSLPATRPLAGPTHRRQASERRSPAPPAVPASRRAAGGASASGYRRRSRIRMPAPCSAPPGASTRTFSVSCDGRAPGAAPGRGRATGAPAARAGRPRRSRASPGRRGRSRAHAALLSPTSRPPAPGAEPHAAARGAPEAEGLGGAQRERARARAGLRLRPRRGRLDEQADVRSEEVRPAVDRDDVDLEVVAGLVGPAGGLDGHDPPARQRRAADQGPRGAQRELDGEDALAVGHERERAAGTGPAQQVGPEQALARRLPAAALGRQRHRCGRRRQARVGAAHRRLRGDRELDADRRHGLDPDGVVGATADAAGDHRAVEDLTDLGQRLRVVPEARGGRVAGHDLQSPESGAEHLRRLGDADGDVGLRRRRPRPAEQRRHHRRTGHRPCPPHATPRRQPSRRTLIVCGPRDKVAHPLSRRAPPRRRARTRRDGRRPTRRTRAPGAPARHRRTRAHTRPAPWAGPRDRRAQRAQLRRASRQSQRARVEALAMRLVQAVVEPAGDQVPVAAHEPEHEQGGVGDVEDGVGDRHLRRKRRPRGRGADGLGRHDEHRLEAGGDVEALRPPAGEQHEATEQRRRDVVGVPFEADGVGEQVGSAAVQRVRREQPGHDRGRAGAQAARERHVRADPELVSVDRVQRREPAHREVAAVVRDRQVGQHREAAGRLDLSSTCSPSAQASTSKPGPRLADDAGVATEPK